MMKWRWLRGGGWCDGCGHGIPPLGKITEYPNIIRIYGYEVKGDDRGGAESRRHGGWARGWEEGRRAWEGRPVPPPPPSPTPPLPTPPAQPPRPAKPGLRTPTHGNGPVGAGGWRLGRRVAGA